MIESLLLITNSIILLYIFREIHQFKKELYLTNLKKEELTKELFQKFKNRLYVISAINSSIETNLEFNKLDEFLLLESIKDISSNIKSVENEIRVLENKLFS